MAKAQSVGQAADSPSSFATGSWSFRSSWLSVLASLGAGLDGTGAGVDAENGSSASTKQVLEQPDRAVLAATATLSNHTGLLVQQEGIQPGNPTVNQAFPLQKGFRSDSTVAQTGSGIQLQGAANPFRSSESAQPAESASGAHSASSKRSVKVESASGAATDGSLALAMLAPSAASPVANAAEAPRSAQAHFSAEDSMNPVDSGVAAASSHSTAALPQATGLGRSTAEDLDGAGAASLASKEEAPPSERTRPRVEAPEPAQVVPGSLVQPQLGLQGLETVAGLDASGGGGQLAATAASQVDPSSAALSAPGKSHPASRAHASVQAVSRLAHGNSAQPAERENRALNGQSAAQTFDASTLMRDPAGGGTINGNAHGGTVAFTGIAAKEASGETFAALDAETTPGAPTWIHAGLQRAEAGFQDPALGWVGVRADLSAGGVHASLVPDSTDAAQTLGGHLAGLNSYLAEQHAPVETVTLAAPEGRWAGPVGDQGANQGMNHGAGHGGFSESQSNPPPASSSLVPARSLEDSIQPISRDVEVPITGSRGANISLMA